MSENIQIKYKDLSEDTKNSLNPTLDPKQTSPMTIDKFSKLPGVKDVIVSVKLPKDGETLAASSVQTIKINGTDVYPKPGGTSGGGGKKRKSRVRKGGATNRTTKKTRGRTRRYLDK